MSRTSSQTHVIDELGFEHWFADDTLQPLYFVFEIVGHIALAKAQIYAYTDDQRLTRHFS